VRVVLLTGTGDAFSSGADLSGADAHEKFDITALDRANRIIRGIVTLDKPVVAAVNGVAAGVGCSAALACDLAVAKESALFLLAFSRIGLMPDGGATATVAAAVGRPRAMRMALLGEGISGREAYDAGLVSHVAADDEFETAGGHQEGGQRGDAGPPRGRPRAGADRPDHLAAHRRRRRGDAGVRREAASGLPRRLSRRGGRFHDRLGRLRNRS
jgi:enoyl-CoA hydratase